LPCAFYNSFYPFRSSNVNIAGFHLQQKPVGTASYQSETAQLIVRVRDNPCCKKQEIAHHRQRKGNNLPPKTAIMDGTIRANIKPGMLVNIILKKDQQSGVLTEGVVKNILTSAPKHHRGIKVRLEDGQIGRVQEILDADTD